MAGLEDLYAPSRGGGGGAPHPPRFSQLARETNYDNYDDDDPHSGFQVARDPVLPRSSKESVSSLPSGESEKYAGLGIGVAGLIAENLLSHPLIVVRRQCQVNIASARNHATPVSLLPVLLNLNRWQGIGVLWKGLGSSLVVKGIIST